ncbi:MAG: COX15/CtaA family protein [Phycisphaeraceae bacterium]|nr:COX15/CtaA family protein [Phycisphaeraceae bacterium]
MTTPETLTTPNTLTVPKNRLFLHLFCVFSVLMTFCLLILGGTVTSKGAGMSVPDWPNTYNYNMFLFPISMWKGDVFWEHTHRLWASGIGVLAIILCVWMWGTQKSHRWVSWLGTLLLVMVIIQGVLGGIRVTEMDWRFGIVHGILGQVYFCLLILAAAVTGKRWNQSPPAQFQKSQFSKPIRLGWILLFVLLIQLSLGAAMRHSGAGLSVPDFPTFYGSWLPPMSQESLDIAIDSMPENIQHDTNGDVVHFTLWHVHLHMGHRFWALVVVIHVGLLLKSLRGFFPSISSLSKPMIGVLLLLVIQLGLGMLVIWSGKHPEIATIHQVTGATLLGLVTLVQIRMMRLKYLAKQQAENNNSLSQTATGVIA